jgi:hypothetical protein
MRACLARGKVVVLAPEGVATMAELQAQAGGLWQLLAGSSQGGSSGVGGPGQPGAAAGGAAVAEVLSAHVLRLHLLDAAGGGSVQLRAVDPAEEGAVVLLRAVP